MKTALTMCFALLAAGAASAEEIRYQLDPQHTFVNFEVKHNKTSTLRGRFERTQGTVSIDRAAKTGRLDVTINADSVSTSVVPLDGRLKGADFLDAAQFPTATFRSEKMTFADDKVESVTGQLTIVGKSFPVTLTALGFNCYDSPFYKREICGGDFEAQITRSQWGMSYGLQAGVPDSVRLLIQVEAIRQ